ncbi:restriction endonuclease subunit S [Bizionia saleffrena]|uniref:Restriction endonuclease subunit S n=1 Tax=Bizionia saleffrena TaxID=291189 RepID=A0A8H2LG17_9FLAO|nr:restriction endonuclease subunit S [Bizionia saleffrena]TYB73026.1 restriction endonuclease subunit S [Bizionia saleffrena]
MALQATAHKKGFKETKLGWIPEDWEVCRINEVFKFLRSNSYSRSNLEYSTESDGIRNIHYGDIHTTYTTGILNCEDFRIIPKVKNEIKVGDNYDRLQNGDIVIADASEDYEGVGSIIELVNIGNLKIVAGLHTFALRDNTSKTVIGFRNNILSNEKVKNELRRIATGSKVYGISKYNFQKFGIIIPPLQEQKAIANCLTTWDTAITKQNALIKAKQQLKKALMQQLLSGKKRLAGFSGEWEEKRIIELFDEINDKNDGGEHEPLSISAGKGFRSQREKFDRVIAGTSLSKYIQLKKGDFSYNKGNSKSYKMGCIYLLETYDTALVPFVFISFRPTDKVDSHFYKHYFIDHGLDRQLKMIISSGARGDGLLNVSKKDFFKLKLPFPSKKEQTTIAQVLNTADQEINLLINQRNQLKLQKKGLMQQLLTGKKRLKV